MDASELKILETLERALERAGVRPELERVAKRVLAALEERPARDLLAWEAVPLLLYGPGLPEAVRSSWVFAIRARSTTGPERHPNSCQRMRSFRGKGDLQTLEGGAWRRHPLRSRPGGPILEGWVSVPPNTWHQAVTPAKDWVVVSFQTAAAANLIEERPDGDDFQAVRRRTYLDEDG